MLVLKFEVVSSTFEKRRRERRNKKTGRVMIKLHYLKIKKASNLAVKVITRIKTTLIKTVTETLITVRKRG